MEEKKIQLEHHYYKELIEDDGAWREMQSKYEMFTASERKALLDKPSGYSEDEIYAVTAVDGDKIVGGHILFTTRVKLCEEMVIAQTGTYLYSKEEYQKQNVGAFVFFDSMRLRQSKNGLYYGISQMALGLYKALKFNVFEYPRLIYLKKSRSVVERVFRTNSVVIKPLVLIGDLLLKIHRNILSRFDGLKGYKVEETINVPDEVIDIINADTHPFSELHDKAWFEWVLNGTFREDSTIKRKLFVVKKNDKTVAFFATKQEFLEQASSRGFKNVTLGTIMEWGIAVDSELTEDKLYVLAIRTFTDEIDAIQVAATEDGIVGRLKKKLFVQVGYCNMAVKIKEPKIDDIGDKPKWRYRIGGGGIFID